VTQPVLGLALGRSPSPSLVPLLVALFAWCRPTTLDPPAVEPTAILTTSARVDGCSASVPLGLWTGSLDELRSPIGARASAIVSDRPEVVDAAGSRGVFAAAARWAENRRPMSPFVRRRLRIVRGLPTVSLLEQVAEGWRWTGRRDVLDDDLVATAMASASAVSVRDPMRVLEALAWGAPCVCDRVSADRVGALDETHVLVGESERQRAELASQLAGDQELAARLSWAGRRLVERRHDVGLSAMRLVALLALLPPPHRDPIGGATLQLRMLGTPASSRIVARLAEAAAPIHVQ
jgi:hypothetical protein